MTLHLTTLAVPQSRAIFGSLHIQYFILQGYLYRAVSTCDPSLKYTCTGRNSSWVGGIPGHPYLCMKPCP